MMKLTPSLLVPQHTSAYVRRACVAEKVYELAYWLVTTDSKRFFLLYCIQAGSRIHPAPVWCVLSPFTEVKAAGALNLITYYSLLLTIRMTGVTPLFPSCHCGCILS